MEKRYIKIKDIKYWVDAKGVKHDGFKEIDKVDINIFERKNAFFSKNLILKKRSPIFKNDVLSEAFRQCRIGTNGYLVYERIFDKSIGFYNTSKEVEAPIFATPIPVKPSGAIIFIDEADNLTPEVILKWLEKLSMELYGENYSFEFINEPTDDEIKLFKRSSEEFEIDYWDLNYYDSEFLSFRGAGWSRLYLENFTAVVSCIFNFPLYTTEQLIKVMKREYPTELYFDEEGSDFVIVLDKDDYVQIKDNYTPVSRNGASI